jgi:hypothetical protein
VRALALRTAGVTVLFVAVLVGGAPIAAATAPAAPPPALTHQTATANPEPGPTLDPQTEADARKDRSRLVVAGSAALLLGLVLWGRHLRKKRRKPGS